MMIKLQKATKVKLLKAISISKFSGDDFPELSNELKLVQIELIDSSEQVDHDNVKLNSDDNRN